MTKKLIYNFLSQRTCTGTQKSSSQKSYMAKDTKYRNLQKITPEIATTYASAEVSELTRVYCNITFQNITATADNPFGVFYADNVKLVNCKIITGEGKNKLQLTNARLP